MNFRLNVAYVNPWPTTAFRVFFRSARPNSTHVGYTNSVRCEIYNLHGYSETDPASKHIIQHIRNPRPFRGFEHPSNCQFSHVSRAVKYSNLQFVQILNRDELKVQAIIFQSDSIMFQIVRYFNFLNSSNC